MVLEEYFALGSLEIFALFLLGYLESKGIESCRDDRFVFTIHNVYQSAKDVIKLSLRRLVNKKLINLNQGYYELMTHGRWFFSYLSKDHSPKSYNHWIKKFPLFLNHIKRGNIYQKCFFCGKMTVLDYYFIHINAEYRRLYPFLENFSENHSKHIYKGSLVRHKKIEKVLFWIKKRLKRLKDYSMYKFLYIPLHILLWINCNFKFSNIMRYVVFSIRKDDSI